MMYNYPFFSFPSFRNYQYYRYPHMEGNLANSPSFNEQANNTNSRTINYNKKESKYKNINTTKGTKNTITSTRNLLPAKNINKQKNKEDKNNTDILFEIFGIKLYFDDILLICLLFFLYSEGVKDDYLFISLILLLLS